MVNNKKTCAIIAAAGSGVRMGGVSKPNIVLLGKTLFEYVLGAFNASSVDEIVVVCSEDNGLSLSKLAKGNAKPVKFVRGGSTRAVSVFNGISASDAEIFCVHDCARPFITPDIINAAVLSAATHGASCVASPITDTVKLKSDTGEIITLDRSKMFAVQTPQCFKKSLYLLARANAENAEGFTDETSLLEQSGIKVEYILNHETNLKLTSASDIPLAEAIMKSRGDKQC